MVKDLKQLKKFLQLCREQGVDSIRFEGVEVHLGAMPYKASKTSNTMPHKATPVSTTYAPGGITDDTSILTDELTPDQLLFWSSEGTDKAPAEEQQ